MNIRAKIFGNVSPEETVVKAKKPKGAKADTLNSVLVTRETRRLSNGRGEDRHRLVDESARATWNGVERSVELLNLSGGGAMISAAFAPNLWDRVDLHLGQNGLMECAVRWIRDGRIGLEFAHETRLDWPSDQVASVLREVVKRSFPQIGFADSQEPQPLPSPPEGADEHRIAKRHPLIWSGKLHHDYTTDTVRIRNISNTGAMIETPAVVRVGSEPLLELSDSASLSVTVEWAVGDQIGVRFHQEFDMQLLIQSRPSVAGLSWAPPAYLDIDAKESADRWNRLSVAELQRELEGFLRH